MTIIRDADGEAYHHGLQCSVRSASYTPNLRCRLVEDVAYRKASFLAG